MRVIRLFAMLASIACAQTTMSPPLIGFVRDPAGHVRRLFGVAGTFVLGPPESGAVLDRPLAKLRHTIEGKTLILRRTDGSEKRVPLPAAAAEPQQIGEVWLVAWPFVIRVDGDRADVYRLPIQEVAR